MGLRPPALAEGLVRATAPAAYRAAQLGDLAEEFHDRADRDGPARAARWYWRQALGSMVPNLRERVRSGRRRLESGTKGDGMPGTLWQDLRFALRNARKHPGFSAVVVTTLALGIGANTTIFSVVHGLVLNPFPFPEAHRIVGVGTAYPRLGEPLGFFENLSPAEYLDVRDQARTLEDVVAWDMGNRQLTGEEGIPENVFAGFWWGDALRTLEMDPHLGRGFSDEEIRRGDRVALLSYGLWRDGYGADSTMVGRSLQVNGVPHTLIGVLPPGVDLYGMDLWTVLQTPPERYPRNRRTFQVIARISEGVPLAEVNTELEGIARRVEQAWVADFEEYGGWSIRADTWTRISTRFFRTGVWIVMGAVGFVLLLICANTANLLLARAQTRRREMAVRTALGAGRGRLVTQLLVESLLLASVAGGVGVGIAWLGVDAFGGFLTRSGFPVAGTVEINAPVLLFTAAVAVATGLFFGLVPAFQWSGTRVAETLQAEGRAVTGGARHQRLQRTFVAVEVALAFVLLAGGGLLVHSFARLNAVDPGFDTEDVLTMRLTLPREEYEGDAVPAFFQELTERLEGLPGLTRAAAASQYPPIAFMYRDFWIEGAEADPDGTLPVALTTVVTEGYFETMGVPLVRGRGFTPDDVDGAPLVAVINEAAARRYFPGRDPIGQRLKIGAADEEVPWWEIVGVVESTRNRGLDQEPFPELFAVHDQIGGGQNQLFLLLRTDVEPMSLLPAVRETVREMDAHQPVYAIQTVESAFASEASTRRLTTGLLSAFALFALLLAATGIYSVVSYTVSRRTQEIGVRIALGADGGAVRGLVVRQALVPVIVGAAVGLALAIPQGMALRQMLFEVGATDPLTYTSVGILLVGVAVVASWVPAYRAARLDPVEALRDE